LNIFKDVLELDVASNSGVDNIRDIIEKAQFSPIKARYKVYIIDEVHALTGAASQALLKTLEEPPQRVIFILCTTEPQKLPNTIISRCQRFNFRRISPDVIAKHLKAIAVKENISITDEAVAVIAKLAQGGMRDAQTLLDQLSLLDTEITPEVVYHLGGNVPSKQLLELVKAVNSENVNQVLKLIRELIGEGKEPVVILQNLTEFYTDLLTAKTVVNCENQPLYELAKTRETNEILAAQQHLRQCESQVRFNSQPALWLEVAILGLLPSVLLRDNLIKTTNLLPGNFTINNHNCQPVLSKF
jgi:DNA polymerase III subunit gamma/tau